MSYLSTKHEKKNQNKKSFKLTNATVTCDKDLFMKQNRNKLKLGFLY